MISCDYNTSFDIEPAPKLDALSKMKFDKGINNVSGTYMQAHTYMYMYMYMMYIFYFSDGHVIPTEPEKETPKDRRYSLWYQTQSSTAFSVAPVLLF